MALDFARLAAGTTIASTAEFPQAAGVARRRAADPALVTLVTQAAADGKRRELPGTFSTTPYPGRTGANEAATVVAELHRAARQVGTRLAVRRFDRDADTCRLTFRVREDDK